MAGTCLGFSPWRRAATRSARAPRTSSPPSRRTWPPSLRPRCTQPPPPGVVTKLLEASDVRIERIISHGHASAADFWYDQAQAEWVIVLKGAARLQFEDGTVGMKMGDFINIPAAKKHRGDWTTPDEPTVWLGVRYEGGAES